MNDADNKLVESVVKKRSYGAYIIVAIFVLPIIAAWLLQPYQDELIADGSLSHGQLVTPQKEMKAFSFTSTDGQQHTYDILKQKWSLMALHHGECDQLCKDKAYKIQQIRLAQGEGMTRIQRIYFTRLSNLKSYATLEKEYQGMRVLGLEASDYEKLRHFLGASEGEIGVSDIYIADPLAYYMMRYAGDLNPRGLIRDLAKLLKLSRVG